MGRLADPELSGFEEHLLICGQCQDRLAREDAFRQGMRVALARTPQKSAAGRSFPVSWILVLAALAVIVVAVIAWPRPTALPATLLQLQADRGPQDQPPAAPAGQPLLLLLDTTGLPAIPSYRVEVVDFSGQARFQSDVAPSGGRVRASLAKGLPAGAYFVRLYSPGRELLREFALTARR